CAFYFIRAELQTARELAERCLNLAQSIQKSGALLVAHNLLNQILYGLGEVVSAQAHQEQGLVLYKPQKHNPHVSGGLLDQKVTLLTYAAMALWDLGYPDQALKKSQEAFTLAQELSHPFSLAFALFSVSRLHLLRREEQKAQEWAEAMITLCTEQGF